jgi:bifunctional non-homologous end joining protein LigD
MRVEDHPLEYGTFEGVIPEGYGAGIVMLWDRGTWVPEVNDVPAALKKGDLKLRLDGYKLKGSWALVRTRGYGDSGKPSWLLIKHKDHWSGPIDITEFAPLSVKSEGDFADILAQDRPEIWLSNRPARGGEAGAMLQKIVARALELKAEAAPVKAAETPTRKGKPAKKRAAAKAGVGGKAGKRARSDLSRRSPENGQRAKEVSAARGPSSRESRSTPRRPARTPATRSRKPR